MEFLIYLDACCLNRPFDDQTQERIHLEAQAVLRILVKFQRGDWQLLGSEAFDDELEMLTYTIRLVIHYLTNGSVALRAHSDRFS